MLPGQDVCFGSGVGKTVKFCDDTKDQYCRLCKLLLLHYAHQQRWQATATHLDLGVAHGRAGRVFVHRVAALAQAAGEVSQVAQHLRSNSSQRGGRKLSLWETGNAEAERKVAQVAQHLWEGVHRWHTAQY